MITLFGLLRVGTALCEEFEHTRKELRETTTAGYREHRTTAAATTEEGPAMGSTAQPQPLEDCHRHCLTCHQALPAGQEHPPVIGHKGSLHEESARCG